jgi:putative CocE/NonD family hydrolase
MFMTTHSIESVIRRIRIGSQRAGSAAALALAVACVNEPDALSGDPQLLEATERSAELQRSENAVPDYTPEELAQLAETPEVKANLEPFGKAPAPDRQLHVPMSDGTRIAVSLYYPPKLDAEAGHASPSVYTETWYTRQNEATGQAVDLYRNAGFVVAIADPRGFGASFGSQDGYITELQRRDQRELIAWLADQPWSNGKVAGIGISASAMLNEVILASGAPALRAGIVRETEWDQYADNLFPGGVPNPRMHDLVTMIFGWMRGDPCIADLAACAEVGIPSVDGDSDFRILQAALRDHQSNIAPDALATAVYRDDRIGSTGFDDVSAKAQKDALRRYAVPARVVASWLDGATAQAALARYNALPEVPMQVTIAPTTHLGGLRADPFDTEAFTPARPEPEEQFGGDIAFLKRTLAGEPVSRKVSYYVLGANSWKTSDVWPPRNVDDHTLSLSKERLTRRPLHRSHERQYTVDPSTSTGLYNRWHSQDNHAIYYGDRRFAQGELLHFDAAEQQHDGELVGAPELCLAMRSDQTDGAVFAYLEDVAPDGRVTYLTEGVLRLMHRKTSSGGCNPAHGTERSFNRADAAPVTPGELMHVEIPLLPVAAKIAKGHHVRLSIAGADAESFNLLTELPTHWTIVAGGPEGSSVTLPMRAWSEGD